MATGREMGRRKQGRQDQGRRKQGRRKQSHYQVTFAVLSAAIAAYALLQSLVIPVLTTLQAQLHTSQDAATWVLTAYLLSASIFTPILGRVGDMIGKERVFVVVAGRAGRRVGDGRPCPEHRGHDRRPRHPGRRLAA